MSAGHVFPVISMASASGFRTTAVRRVGTILFLSMLRSLATTVVVQFISFRYTVYILGVVPPAGHLFPPVATG